MSGDLTAVALSAFFGLCVPATSQGKIEQKLPSSAMIPLTSEEKHTYADAIRDDDQAYRIESDAGLVLMTVKGGFCRIITGEGDTNSAADQFRQDLKAAGGDEDRPEEVQNGYLAIDGMIPLTDHDAVALVFTVQKNSNSGFFASAFGVHKD